MMRFALTFFGTLLDHVGVPLPLIVVVISLRTEKEDLLTVFIAAMLALLTSDFLTLFLGKYILKTLTVPRKSLLPNTKTHSRITHYAQKLIDSALIPGRWIILFSKFIPIVGKYVPVAIGYNNIPWKNYLPILVMGDVLYALCYIVLSFYFGEAIRNQQFVITFILGLVFLSLYIFSYLLSKKKLRSIQR
ncbi:hypothetical protein ACSFC1_10945 [Pseudothermotoga sp. U03pept]|uniref:hypothetical protein n=1 Tax=Pseudothermotoga sp. U03pept TaxID=3447012 RepID=UPI003F07472A